MAVSEDQKCKAEILTCLNEASIFIKNNITERVQKFLILTTAEKKRRQERTTQFQSMFFKTAEIAKKCTHYAKQTQLASSIEMIFMFQRISRR